MKRFKNTLFLILWIIFIIVLGFWFIQQENRQTEMIQATRIIKDQTKEIVQENQNILKNILEHMQRQGQ